MYHGTVFETDHRQERAHGLHHAKRILAIRDCDEGMTNELRHETLAHLLEEQIRIGMLQAIKKVKLPSDHFMGVDRAPKPFEKGSRRSGVKGVDLIMSYNEKSGMDKLRKPKWAFDVKSYSRRLRLNDFQYNPLTGTPSFLHLCGGNWIISPEGKSMHHLILESSKDNLRAQRCIEFVENNLLQFGTYMLHEVSSAMNIYAIIADRYGHLRHCCPEWNNVFPEDPQRFDRVLADTYQIHGALIAGGIYPIWGIDGSANKHNDWHRFLPTTPLQ